MDTFKYKNAPIIRKKPTTRADIVAALRNGETVSVSFTKKNGQHREMRATGVKEQPEVCDRLGRTLVLENINGIPSYRQVDNRTVKLNNRLRPFMVYVSKLVSHTETALAQIVFAHTEKEANILAKNFSASGGYSELAHALYWEEHDHCEDDDLFVFAIPAFEVGE